MPVGGSSQVHGLFFIAYKRCTTIYACICSLFQVGKAWLALARMYQYMGEVVPVCADKAVVALQRARSVCKNCAESCGTPMQSVGAFDYLEERAQRSSRGGTPAVTQ